MISKGELYDQAEQIKPQIIGMTSPVHGGWVLPLYFYLNYTDCLPWRKISYKSSSTEQTSRNFINIFKEEPLKSLSLNSESDSDSFFFRPL